MKVELVNFNPDWSKEFVLEKSRLTKSIKNKKTVIEHIGSTAITNISSKPVIDILMGVEDLSNLDLLIPDLKYCGYEYISKYENIFPQRRFFKRISNESKMYNVHAVTLDSYFRSRHIMFRDWLRYEEKDRTEYEKLKLTLAGHEWDDINDYANAKTDFIKRVESKALIEMTKIFENSEIEAKYDMFNASVGSIEVKYDKSNNGGFAFNCKGLPPYFNRIIGAGLNGAITDEYLFGIKKFYKGTKSFMIQIAVPAYQNETKELLKSHQFVLNDHWVRTYRTTSNTEKYSTNFQIKEADNFTIEDYSKIIRKSFNMPENASNLTKGLVNRKNWKNYLVFDDDRPIGTGGIFISDKTGWLGFACTIPEYRRKGVQNTLVQKRIESAIENGCIWVIAETESEKNDTINQSYRNLLVNGFVHLYTRDNWVYEKV